ncbi:hypothetical protein [Microbacterium radiodurans]|uniref:WxL domain-containing protein n=1 Tax=Microbacterium radiodurans TaxID=661398 RepID=A0A5J5IPX2_9MICO|nr:hypothetical protein [Microbacterium radiodurans]KAA9083757.1 hypothetical protein F6B42_14500 [Microbacterium radiodurans]
MRKLGAVRCGAIMLGTALLASAGTAIAHADEVVDEGDVEINVEVTDRYPSGVLALSVAADSTVLTEIDSGDPLVREFTGALPAVTVTDTRSVAPDVPWYVLGTAGDFIGADSTITAEHLGWAPYLADDYGPSLEAGFDVATVIDDPDSEGLGYADGELLYVNTDQLDTYDQGSWTASADLQLKVDATSVAPGAYTSVLTLSLFE